MPKSSKSCRTTKKKKKITRDYKLQTTDLFFFWLHYYLRNILNSWPAKVYKYLPNHMGNKSAFFITSLFKNKLIILPGRNYFLLPILLLSHLSAPLHTRSHERIPTEESKNRVNFFPASTQYSQPTVFRLGPDMVSMHLITLCTFLSH